MENYRIRSANYLDVDVLKAIYKQEKEHIGSFNLYQIWDNFLAGKGPNKFIIVEGEEPIAMCNYSYSIRKNYYVINDVGVLANHKKKGVGRLIVEAIKSKAHREGKQLVLKCNCDNKPANQFYEKVGMKLKGINYTRSKGVKQNIWII